MTSLLEMHMLPAVSGDLVAAGEQVCDDPRLLGDGHTEDEEGCLLLGLSEQVEQCVEPSAKGDPAVPRTCPEATQEKLMPVLEIDTEQPVNAGVSQDERFGL
jgi:hypothetical protein